MTKARIFSKDLIYHVYNRGNHKERVYHDAQDYNYFLKKLRIYSEEMNFDIICYCLMPNHFHFCLRQNSSCGLDKLFKKLIISYTKYYNQKYLVVGHVFQGRFKYKTVLSDKYLLHLSLYIHNNPRDLEKITPAIYKYSSYHEYIHGQQGLCQKNLILGMISIKDYKRQIELFSKKHNVKDIEFSANAK